MLPAACLSRRVVKDRTLASGSVIGVPSRDPGGTISFQFHATPAEVADLVRAWAKELGGHLVVERFEPSYVADVATDGEVPDDSDRYSICARAPVVDVSSGLQFLNANQECLVIWAPRLSDAGLTETVVGGGTDDLAVLTVWRNLVRRLRRVLHVGAVVRSVDGVVASAPSHRHTSGAHGLAQSGVPMRASAGGVRYEFNDVDGALSFAAERREVWKLIRDGRVLARLVPMTAGEDNREGTLLPGDDFDLFRLLFDEFAAAERADDDERADLALDRIRRTMALRHPDGHEVAEFIVRVDGDRAAWLWSDDTLRGQA